MKTAFVSGVLFACLVPAIDPSPALEAATSQQCENVLPHEPIVLYELTGSTIAAQVDRTLTVYADGAMKLTSASATGPGTCIAGRTTPELALALQDSLVKAGGSVLCDDTRVVTDVPLHTLTLLRGGQDARAHTFSYWLGDQEYTSLNSVLESFIAVQFPKF